MPGTDKSQPLPTFPEEWDDYLARSKREFTERYNMHLESHKSLKDFVLVQTIGKGSYGTVVVAKAVNEDEYFAVKIIEKSRIVRASQVQQTLIEKRMLNAIRFPFIVHMEHYFKDNSYLYFVMPYVVGGEMFTILRKSGKFEEKKSVFYAAQVVLAFEYLHYLNVVYRDLKPENLLFDEHGYLKITDLGFAKIVQKRTYTLCGTPDYLAPEIILSRGYSFSVDWWALGVLIFEMCCGVPPFYSKDVTQTYEFIVTRSFRSPYSFSDTLKDLVDKLLQVDASRRLGCLKGGVADVKNHSWFKNISWLDLLNKKVKAPYVPQIRSKGDTSNFDEYEDMVLSHHQEDMFKEQLKDF